MNTDTSKGQGQAITTFGQWLDGRAEKGVQYVYKATPILSCLGLALALTLTLTLTLYPAF